MQASVEKTSAIGRKMSVVVPAEKVETAVQQRLKQLAKRVKVQGFRPGKVPMKIVEQQYRGSATSDVLSDLIQSSLQKALVEQKITPAVQPDITPEPLEKGKDFTYVADFDVYPEFKKLNLEGVEIVKPESEVQDADIERVLENMRKQQIKWNEVKRKSKKGDRVVINFTGTIDGEAFAGGTANDYPIVLGEGQMLPDFEKGVQGMQAGDKETISVKFPEDYQADLVGKTAQFEIEAVSVSESELPEVDEEFIKSFGIESGKEADLRKEVRNNLETNLQQQLSSTLRQRVFDALLEQNETELPLKMVKEEAKRINEEQKNQMLSQGIDAKMLENLPEPDFEVIKPQAEKRVALGLIMMEIIREKDIKPDEKRVEERIKTMASSYQDPQGFIDYYKSNQQALAQVQSVVLEEQVVDYLIDNTKLKTEKVDATELLKMQ